MVEYLIEYSLFEGRDENSIYYKKLPERLDFLFAITNYISRRDPLIDKIDNLFISYGVDEGSPDYSFVVSAKKIEITFRKNKNLMKYRFEIYDMNDEYFYVLINEFIPYKCDQKDGLIKLLKDVLDEIFNRI
jgi:hypothetical protein